MQFNTRGAEISSGRPIRDEGAAGNGAPEYHRKHFYKHGPESGIGAEGAEYYHKHGFHWFRFARSSKSKVSTKSSNTRICRPGKNRLL
jgi:hypothetical protein